MPTDEHPDFPIVVFAIACTGLVWRVDWCDRQFRLSVNVVGVEYLLHSLKCVAAGNIDLPKPSHFCDPRQLVDGGDVDVPPFYWVKWPLGCPVTVKFGPVPDVEFILGFDKSLVDGLLAQCEYLLKLIEAGDVDASDVDVR